MEAPYTPAQYDDELDTINWISGIPFILLHIACILVFWAEFSWVALAALLISYTVRILGITAGFHRYFSHRSFKTSRFFNFAWLFWAQAALKKVPCGGQLTTDTITSIPIRKKMYTHRYNAVYGGLMWVGFSATTLKQLMLRW